MGNLIMHLGQTWLIHLTAEEIYFPFLNNKKIQIKTIYPIDAGMNIVENYG